MPFHSPLHDLSARVEQPLSGAGEDAQDRAGRELNHWTTDDTMLETPCTSPFQMPAKNWPTPAKNDMTAPQTACSWSPGFLVPGGELHEPVDGIGDPRDDGRQDGDEHLQHRHEQRDDDLRDQRGGRHQGGDQRRDRGEERDERLEELAKDPERRGEQLQDHFSERREGLQQRPDHGKQRPEKARHHGRFLHDGGQEVLERLRVGEVSEGRRHLHEPSSSVRPNGGEGGHHAPEPEATFSKIFPNPVIAGPTRGRELRDELRELPRCSRHPGSAS